jgi:hypothetical protein
MKPCYIILCAIQWLFLSVSAQSISSFHPNGWVGIGRFERFEVGLQVSRPVDSLIERFLTGEDGINPYDYSQVQVRCIFRHRANTYVREGFYYREIAINDSLNTFTAAKSLYPFRIRFSPPEIGSYHLEASITVKGQEAITYTANFTVIESGKRGFLSVGNSWHLKDYHNKPFVGVGQSIPFCDYPTSYVAPDDYKRHRGYIQDLADNGGNLFRLRLDPWCNEVEFEELGVYGSQRKSKENYQRQWQAHELDLIFQKAEENDVYIFLTLLADSYFKIHGSHKFSWQTNPYRTVLDQPEDFFDITNEEAFNLYKNKLRYIMARYGYSSNLAFIGLINETDHLPNYASSADVRRNVNRWVKTTGAFLKEFYPTPLLTNGYAASPDHPDFGVDNSVLFDILTTNHYSDSRRSIKERHDDVPKRMLFSPESTKPFIYGELGSGLCDQDVGHPEWFTDSDFHNHLWASVMYHRALGTPMYWWDWEQDSHRQPEDRTIPGIQHRRNFQALNTFFTVSPPPFETNVFYSNWDSDLGVTGRLAKRKIEWIENVNAIGTKGFGWVHNSDYYWINDPLRLRRENCPDCKYGGSDAYNDTECYQEKASDIYQFNEPKGPYEYPEKHETISLNRYRPLRNFKIEIWSCYGKGGLVDQFTEKSDLFGIIKFKRKVGTYPGDPEHGDPDFAFKVSLANEDFEQFALAFPNPFDEHFDVKSDKFIKGIVVYNGVGRLVKTVQGLTTQEFRCFMESEPSGLYFVHIIFNDGHISQFKLIKR